jgi:5-(carboxyamino)imidazole ribonucleotide mutase
MIGVVMGSKSDWRIMSNAVQTLAEFDVEHEYKVVSAHRTPDFLYEYGKTAEDRGLEAIIAGAGGAAHLPGMLAALTPVPVLGVPIMGDSPKLAGMDSLFSIVQMPNGVPVATFGVNCAKNAALFVVSMLARTNPQLKQRYVTWRQQQTNKVMDEKLPLKP